MEIFEKIAGQNDIELGQNKRLDANEPTAVQTRILNHRQSFLQNIERNRYFPILDVTELASPFGFLMTFELMV
jgi:hypothetical protein